MNTPPDAPGVTPRLATSTPATAEVPVTSRLRLSELGRLSDEGLAVQCQKGDRAALEVLVRRFRGMARAKARHYFLVGSDADDVEQEALIGLYKAARDFRSDRESSFRAFADLCMTRQIISAIKAAGRHKHQPLNQYLSLSGRSAPDDREERRVEDLLEDHRCADPADAVIFNEQVGRMRQALQERLTAFEVEVLGLYAEGQSYQQIGALLDRRVKSIDNALQRTKRKLDQHLHHEHGELPALVAA